VNFRAFQKRFEVYSFHPAQREFKVPERVLERAAPERHRGSILEYFI
jgi:hypothetical protein